jgi:hypothetical protein
MEFNEDTTLKQVLEFSGGEDVLLKYRVPCLGCPMAQMEMGELTLKEICAAYRIDLKSLIIDLNIAGRNYDK